MKLNQLSSVLDNIFTYYQITADFPNLDSVLRSTEENLTLYLFLSLSLSRALSIADSSVTYYSLSFTIPTNTNDSSIYSNIPIISQPKKGTLIVSSKCQQMSLNISNESPSKNRKPSSQICPTIWPSDDQRGRTITFLGVERSIDDDVAVAACLVKISKRLDARNEATCNEHSWTLNEMLTKYCKSASLHISLR